MCVMLSNTLEINLCYMTLKLLKSTVCNACYYWDPLIKMIKTREYFGEVVWDPGRCF